VLSYIDSSRAFFSVFGFLYCYTCTHQTINMLCVVLFSLLLTATTTALNFDWEREQLTDEDAARNGALRFGSSSAVPAPGSCKIIPGDAEWPSEDVWTSFNDTLGGVLLKPKPLASVCYTGEGYNAAQCEQLKSSWASMNLQ
jgi:hypothetical protein